MSAVPDRLMTSEEFVDWAMRQPSGRYELVAGRIVAMAPERALHNLTKVAVVRALQDAVASASVPCFVYGDGMTVIIDKDNTREPDALVQCGKPIERRAISAEAPLIVVEVVSPSSGRADNLDKLIEYFSVSTVRHYLIVNPELEVVIHHARLANDDTIMTRILRDGDVELAPPGISFSVRGVFGALPP